MSETKFSVTDIQCAIQTCSEHFVWEVVNSIEFSCGEMNPQEQEKLRELLYNLIEEMAGNL